MEVLYIGINRPSINPPAIAMPMVFLRIKVLNCLRVMKEMDVGILGPETIPIAIV